MRAGEVTAAEEERSGDLAAGEDERPFEQAALGRRRAHHYAEVSGPSVYVLTAEDIILYKLEWFRLGGEISERQWNDD